jgi:hypothetical protein
MAALGGGGGTTVSALFTSNQKSGTKKKTDQLPRASLYHLTPEQDI